jgi:hypothetical protein
MIEAAQKAVGEGDYPEAERLLREAAAIQETTLGSSHPDLASTLNNLAFVCERTNQIAEAERGYRRAHAIAVASLSPGHPFIATSLENLVDFCAAHEIPIWKPPASSAEDEIPESDFAPEPSEVESVADVQDGPVVATRSLEPRMIAVAAAAAAVILVVLLAIQGRGTTDSPSAVAQPRQEEPAPAPAPSPAPVPAPASPPTSAVSKTTPAATRESPPAAAPAPRPAASNADVTVLKAQLCRAITKRGSPDWQCTTAEGDLKPGTYTFYTRLLANAPTTVEHRWYRRDRIHQVMRLRVPPSPGSGYRTFSSNTVSPERADEWKVELRAADGTVLHEARFVVR